MLFELDIAVFAAHDPTEELPDVEDPQHQMQGQRNVSLLRAGKDNGRVQHDFKKMNRPQRDREHA